MDQKIAVVIPSFRVTNSILKVISKIGPEVSSIFVIDDKCPEGSGDLVLRENKDKRVKVIFHSANQGVGGAVITGYKAALDENADIIVKIDGDGQMDPAFIENLVANIQQGDCDYTKGNRFFMIESLAAMPAIRIFGNAVVSFLSKAASGYWNLMDPTNGFTAVHASALRMLPLDKISKGFFFESDMLFRLNTIRAVVQGVPMHAHYENEQSNLIISKVILEFPIQYFNRFMKRIFYNYFLRDFNVCSLQLLIGLLLVLSGAGFGIFQWYAGAVNGVPATAGTVMLAVLPIILGFQSLLAAVGFDVMNIPKISLQQQLLKDSFLIKKNSVAQFPINQVVNR